MKTTRNQLHGMTKQRLAIGLCGALISISTLTGCSEESTSSDTPSEESSTGGAGGTAGAKSTSATQADNPSDSTGQMASIKLDFTTSATSAALRLAGDMPATLDLGTGIVLSDARVNIKSIKLKANSVRSEEEKALKKELESKREEHEKAMEADKKKIEADKDAIEESYEPQMEAAATDEERDALRDSMKADLAALEAAKADLEKEKEAAEEAYEAEHDGNLKWKGPYVYDLVKGTVTPELPAVDVLDGSYRRIEFKVKPARHVEATDNLINKSIFLAGTALINDVTTGFEIAVVANKEFRLSGLGSVFLDATVDNTMAIAFDAKAWLAGVDFSTAAVGADGIIHIDADNNATALRAIEKNIVMSTRFGKDHDGDGKLEDSESEGDGEKGQEEELEEEASQSQDSKDEQSQSSQTENSQTRTSDKVAK